MNPGRLRLARLCLLSLWCVAGTELLHAQEEARIERNRVGAARPSGPSITVPQQSLRTGGDGGRIGGRVDRAVDPVMAYSLQRALDSIRTVQGIEGMSAAVLLPDAAIWIGVSGISSANPLVYLDPGMLLGIGSNSKAFVSTTILSLVDSGVISLDDRLDRWLPPLPNITGSVTIRQLLNMTSGLFDYLNDSNAQGDSVAANPTRLWTPEELIRTFVGPPRAAPGGAYRYCNTNYVLLGMIIKAATGHSVSSEIRKRISTPLLLDHTYLEVEEPYSEPAAHPWDNGWDFASVPVTAHFSTLWTAGGIMSTAENMARWVKGLYEGRVISPVSRSALLTVVPMTSNAAPGLDWIGYGLGVRQGGYYGMPILGHGGAVMGYVSITGFLPRLGVSVAVLTNASETSGGRVLTALLDAYLRTSRVNPPIVGNCYALSGRSDSTRLYLLDTATAAMTSVAPAQFGTMVGARVHPRTGSYWGLTYTSGWELVQIDGERGGAFPRRRVIFPPGSPTDLRGLDFAPDGRLFVGSGDGRLYGIDTLTGIASLAATAKIAISGLAFDPQTGGLWAAIRANPTLRDRIYRILLPSGDTVGAGNTGFNQPLADISFDPSGGLFALVGNPSSSVNYRLARIDRVTGAGSEIGSVGMSGMTGMSFTPAVTGTGSGRIADLTLPEESGLGSNYPNPFNPQTTIPFRVGRGAGEGNPLTIRHVRLAVYDLLGRELDVLVDGGMSAGEYSATWNGAGVASGTYFCRLEVGAGATPSGPGGGRSVFVATRPLLLLR